MKRRILTGLFILGLFTSGTLLSTVRGQEKESRPLPDIITKVYVSSGIDLYLAQGEKISIEIEADKSFLHRIITEVKGHELRIYTKSRINWRRTYVPKVYLTVNQIERVICSAGSDVFTQTTIKADTLEMKASSGADLYASVDTKLLKLSSSSGSDIKVKGKTISLIASAGSGSDIIASDLAAKYVKVKASAGSDAKVYALESIDAHSSSGSDIIYYGNPINISIEKSSGGDITQK